ncbi:MAG TPA: AAA family ATPase [Gammaproteobacteria bacterium]|jgi:receptor protein-tyrosine kinase
MSIIEKAIGKLDSLEEQGIVERKRRRAAEQEWSESDRFKGDIVSLDDQESVSRLRYMELARAAGCLAPEEQFQRAVDEYRRIKRPLVTNAFGKQKKLVKNGRLIAVTSSVPDEGKTYTSVNLGLSLAREMDYSVVLVDADAIKGDLTRVFGLEENLGLMDLLLNQNLKVADILVKTDLANLSILPIGGISEHSNELLASDLMRSLIDSLLAEEENRMILFDSPPVLASPEATVVTSYAGQVVMVVEAVKTPKDFVLAALENFNDAQAVNLVLNKAHRSLGLDPYYGEYYYRYYND